MLIDSCCIPVPAGLAAFSYNLDFRFRRHLRDRIYCKSRCPLDPQVFDDQSNQDNESELMIQMMSCGQTPKSKVGMVCRFIASGETLSRTLGSWQLDLASY